MAHTNYFDEIQEGEPKTIVVGDYLQWKKTDLAETYDPTLYTLTYIGRIAGGGNEINITATNGGTYYLIQESSTTTATYNPGYYHWQWRRWSSYCKPHWAWRKSSYRFRNH